MARSSLLDHAIRSRSLPPPADIPARYREELRDCLERRLLDCEHVCCIVVRGWRGRSLEVEIEYRRAERNLGQLGTFADCMRLYTFLVNDVLTPPRAEQLGYLPFEAVNTFSIVDWTADPAGCTTLIRRRWRPNMREREIETVKLWDFEPSSQ
jgi:hypothetical protein